MYHPHSHKTIDQAIARQEATTAPPPPVVISLAKFPTAHAVLGERAARAFARAKLAEDPTWGTWLGRLTPRSGATQ